MRSYWTPEAFAAKARQHGLAMTPSTAFAGSATAPAAIRISLGGGSDRRQMSVGLAPLSSLLASPPTRDFDRVV
jgi:DNA-binding transcriptional MocR family regulator